MFKFFKSLFVKSVPNTFKMGDKVYVVTRRDLSPGYQAVQSVHAMNTFSHEHSKVETAWFNQSSFLALLTVADECELKSLMNLASEKKIIFSKYTEPDLNNEVTAVAFSPEAGAICKKLPLTLKK